MNDENDKKQKIAELISAIKKAKKIEEEMTAGDILLPENYELLKDYKQKYPESSLDISEDTKNELENVFSQIDDYLDKGIVPLERRFTLPKVPSYLKELGSNETAISLPVSVIKKAKETHGLSNAEIKNSLSRLYDPVAVFDTDKTKSENKLDSKLILTDEFSKTKPVALAINTNTQIQVQENGHRKFIEVQDIRSIHDRTLTAKNGTDLVKQWTRNGLCRYVDDKKISEWSTVARVYFPIEALQSDKNNILTKSEVVNHHNTVAENGSEYHKTEDILKLQEVLKDALKQTAVPLEKIDFTKENFNKLFPRSRIETPIENVKLGANQFEKLELKERQNLLMAVHDTLKNPDLIIREQKENVFGENENNHIYAKSFFINDKVHGIQSVVVSTDGENVSISTHERNINNIVNKIKKPDQLLFAAAKVRLLVEQHTKERLPQSVVNPIRENEYVASPNPTIQQNSDFVKQEENPSVKKSEGDSREKLNVATYKFQSNETLDEIIQSDSSFSTEAALLDNLIDCSIREVYEYATEKEQRVLRVFASSRNEYDTDMKNLAIQTDCAARWIAAKHWNPEKQEFQKEYLNRSAIESFPYELPWEMEEIEKETFVNTQEKEVSTLKSQDEIIDSGIESVLLNGGMSEEAMEAEIAAQNNASYESEEEYTDEIDTFFYDTNGNPHAPQKIIAVLENFQKIEPSKWNLSAEEKTAVFHLTQVTEIGKNDFDNSLAKLKEYMGAEEFEKEESNYAKILTPILLTSLGQDFDEKTHAFSSEKFSYKFSNDDLKKENPAEKGSSLEESRKTEKPVSEEKPEIQRENVSCQDFSAGKIIYGKTVLPPFASMTSDGHIKTCENFIVKGYDSESGSYIAENGDEKLAIPRETFNSLLNPAGLHKKQREEKIFRMEGNGIVFANPEKGVKGTVIPEFSLMTQNGLQRSTRTVWLQNSMRATGHIHCETTTALSLLRKNSSRKLLRLNAFQTNLTRTLLLTRNC